MTYLEEYANAVLSGEIAACHRIKQVYAHLLDKLKHPETYKPWVFDEGRANQPIEFIEPFCKQAQGRNRGKPLKLELFQKAKHQAVFGFIHEETGERQYQEVLDIRGRKNGKTTELAADANYMMLGDGEGSPEVYFIATKLDQAKKGFSEAHKMIMQSDMLKKYLRKRQSDIWCDMNFGTMQALASNSNSLDGLNGHFVVIDELAAIQKRDLYDLMKQSMSARFQPLLNCITTNGFVRNSIYDTQYAYAIKVLDSYDQGKVIDERFLPLIYELDDRDEWDKESCWIKANPGLGTIKSIDKLRGYVEKAKKDPAFKATVMVKDFNMTETSASAWLTYKTLNNQTKFELNKMAFRYCIGGFDGSDTTDLTNAKALCMRPNDNHLYYVSMYWLPEETLIQRSNEDSAPYELWERQGYLRVSKGYKISFYDVLEWYKELRDVHDIYVLYVGYDPWHVDVSVLEAFKNEFGREAMIPVRQGAKTLSSPMKSFKADLDAKLIVYNDNPIDKMCLANTEIKTDINNNIQPVKGIDVRKRIDGTIGFLNSYVVFNDKRDEYLTLI